jgi:hypothetical protein
MEDAHPLNIDGAFGFAEYVNSATTRLAKYSLAHVVRHKPGYAPDLDRVLELGI